MGPQYVPYAFILTKLDHAFVEPDLESEHIIIESEGKMHTSLPSLSIKFGTIVNEHVNNALRVKYICG